MQYRFDFEKQKWQEINHENMLSINKIFKENFAMITDLFNENIIHIAGETRHGHNGYAYLTFNFVNSFTKTQHFFFF